MVPFQGLIATVLGVIGLINNWNKGLWFFWWLVVVLMLADMVWTKQLRDLLKTEGDTPTTRWTAIYATINQIAIIVVGVGSFNS